MNNSRDVQKYMKRRRSTGQEAASLILIIGFFVCNVPLWVINYNSGEPPTSITIVDQNQLISENNLKPELSRIKFYKPTQVVVMGISHGDPDTDLTTKLRRYLQKYYPEFLAANGTDWADSTLIFAFDPEAKQVGIYFGKNFSDDGKRHKEIVAAAESDFLLQKWDSGVITAVHDVSKTLGQPFYFSIIGGLIVTFPGFLILWFFIVRKSQADTSHRLTHELLLNWESLKSKHEKIKIGLEIVSKGSRYETGLAKEFEKYSADYDSLAHIFSTNGKFQEITAGGKDEEAVEKLDASITKLHPTGKVLLNSVEFLNRGKDWQKTWAAETRPLLDSLEKCTQLSDQLLSLKGGAERPASEKQRLVLRTTCDEISQILPELNQDLESRKATPEIALDTIEGWMQRLSKETLDLADARIDQSIASTAERNKIKETLHHTNDLPGYLSSAKHKRTILGTIGAYQGYISIREIISRYPQIERAELDAEPQTVYPAVNPYIEKTTLKTDAGSPAGTNPGWNPPKPPEDPDSFSPYSYSN